MENLVRLTLAVSLPLWSSLAVIGVFAAYFGGVAGIGIMFVLIIIMAAFWNRTLLTIYERKSPAHEDMQAQNSLDRRLTVIEARLDEIYKRIRD